MAVERGWETETEEEKEQEDVDQPEDDNLEYSEWVTGLTAQLEQLVDNGGAGTRWEEVAVRRKFGWAGHMLRRGDARRTARFLRAEETEKKRQRPGHPRSRWTYTFLQRLGDGWQEQAADRYWWRFFAREAERLD